MEGACEGPRRRLACPEMSGDPCKPLKNGLPSRRLRAFLLLLPLMLPTAPQPTASPEKTRYVIWASWVLAGAGLLLVLKTGLLGALLAGLAVYTCTHALARRMPQGHESPFARQISLALVVVVLGLVLTLGGVWIAGFLAGHGSGAGVGALMLRMAEILGELKQILPDWATENWPSSVYNLNQAMIDFLKSHATDVQTAGKDLAKGLTRILIGMVLGGMVALSQLGKANVRAPLADALATRMERFSRAFGQVVSAQVKISLLNTLFTTVFLAVVLPLTGNTLPFTKTMILITFVAGLIPVLGNLISNTVITVIALSVSVWVAVAALAFLVVIHKVEYFLNARIIGGQVQAKAWELLAAMLLMEACFGLPGVIAAPIYYAYLKEELRQQALV